MRDVSISLDMTNERRVLTVVGGEFAFGSQR